MLLPYSLEWCLGGFKEQDIPGKHYLPCITVPLWSYSKGLSSQASRQRPASKQIWDPLKEVWHREAAGKWILRVDMRQTPFPKTDGHLKKTPRSGGWASLWVRFSAGHSVGVEGRFLRHFGLRGCSTQEVVGSWDPGNDSRAGQMDF